MRVLGINAIFHDSAAALVVDGQIVIGRGRPNSRGRRGGTVHHAAVLTLDGRGESMSMLAGEYRNGKLDILATQELPHSPGLMYEVRPARSFDF